jgi:hypothetical protein
MCLERTGQGRSSGDWARRVGRRSQQSDGILYRGSTVSAMCIVCVEKNVLFLSSFSVFALLHRPRLDLPILQLQCQTRTIGVWGWSCNCELTF